jgi:ariadne-1
MSSWSEHDANTGGYYRCNKFVASDSNDVSDAAKAKRESDRYLHYYKRYSAHDQAEKFAKAQLRETEAKMALLQERSQVATWTDVEFLKVANEQLVECRRVLKYSYSFAYYLSNEQEKQMQRQRFEYHQEMLERFTEKLSELSEKSLATMNRTEVVNQTRVVDCFTKNILKYVEDGMEDINETMT